MRGHRGRGRSFARGLGLSALLRRFGQHGVDRLFDPPPRNADILQNFVGQPLQIADHGATQPGRAHGLERPAQTGMARRLGSVRAPDLSRDGTDFFTAQADIVENVVVEARQLGCGLLLLPGPQQATGRSGKNGHAGAVVRPGLGQSAVCVCVHHRS